ncbi:MAG: DUF2300 domain-containing protein [Gallionella sp.]|nr:DUF2300 domain-containing protein [Gallionella sp.]
MRASRYASAIVLMALLLTDQARASSDATVAWLRDGAVQIRALTGALPAHETANVFARNKVPLGSLWKLFVYAYLSDTRAQEPAYLCAAKSSVTDSEERYCCQPGDTVDRDTALARSCAPYFSARRLGIGESAWQAYWMPRTRASWLLDLSALQAATEVPLDELLAALAAIAPGARTEARRAMLDIGFNGYGRDAWTRLGTGIRYKTYSWHKNDGSAVGGAAGWLADGTPFWFAAKGASRAALTTWASQLASVLPEPRQNKLDADDTSCVDVDFFARYPLQAVWQENPSRLIAQGELKGRYRLLFANGQWLRFTAESDMTLESGSLIRGRFGMNEYVARVIDREGRAQPVQAARALAIAARSYLLQNAHFEGGCWHINDSSQTQRVSPNPPSEGAKAAAAFTDQIILNGVAVHYHRVAAGNNRMAWQDAVVRATGGWDFERILNVSFPEATFATLNGRSECARLNAAELWLAEKAPRWQTKLNQEPGYEALDATPKICALADGHPYSDQQRMRIYVRGWRSLDERVTLAHEYLHLALRFHPNGASEDYIEALARQLIGG